MQTEAAHIPALRWGEPYESLDVAEVRATGGEHIAVRVSQVNAGLIRRDLRRAAEARRALAAVPFHKMLEICREAGERFMRADLEGSPEEYVARLSSTTGLPHTLCRANMAKVHKALTEMETVVRGLTRGLPGEIFDRGSGEQQGMLVAYYADADCLGVVLPSNSPGVNSLWLPAVAMKIPVVLKPGREDPWTPRRLILALTAAGCPAAGLSFYGTDHEGADTILQGACRGIVFGGDATVARYAGNPRIQCHGTGRSKVLIGDDCIEDWERWLDVLIDSVAENGGRSCINASAIVVPRFGDEIADALARRLVKVEPLELTDECAMLAGFANPDFARAIDAQIESDLQTAGAEDVTARYRSGPRVVRTGAQTYVQPTVVRCLAMTHPLAHKEFLFPFVAVVEVAQGSMLEVIGPSLVVTAITKNAAWIEQLMASRHIDRLNIGPMATNRVQWDQPHEGNLFEFLFRRRALQRAAAWG